MELVQIHIFKHVNVTGCSLLISGLFFTFLSIFVDFIDQFGVYWIIGNIISSTLAYTIQYTILMLPPLLVIEVILIEFSLKCKAVQKVDVKSSLDIIKFYVTLDQSFSFFLLIFVATTQLMLIFYTFLTYSILLMRTEKLHSDLFFFIGQNLMVWFFSLNLIGIIIACDEAYKSMMHFKKIVERELWQTLDSRKVSDLSYILRLLDDTGPLSAFGYFEVRKSTLTSMLSVRSEVKMTF